MALEAMLWMGMYMLFFCHLTDLKDLMLAVATRGEINSAFIFLGHMAETSGGRRTPLKPEFALLKQVILSGQVGEEN